MAQPLRRVGVLGGMGPAATVLLQSRLIEAVDAQDDRDHVPLIIDMNPQTPSRIAYLIDGVGPSPAPVLTEMAQRLEAAGAEALAMPCNTAHGFVDEIARAVSIPMLDMVALSAARISAQTPAGAAIGMLASPAVQKLGLYDAALPDRQVIWPDDDASVLDAIRQAKAGRLAPARRSLTDAANALRAQGAAALLIACTEFSLIVDVVDAPHVDALDVLVDAIKRFSIGP